MDKTFLTQHTFKKIQLQHNPLILQYIVLYRYTLPRGFYRAKEAISTCTGNVAVVHGHVWRTLCSVCATGARVAQHFNDAEFNKLFILI